MQADEVQALLKSLGIQITGQEITDMMQKIDSSGDGSIQFEGTFVNIARTRRLSRERAEFLEIIKQVGTFREDDDLNEAFKAWDVDSDGSVTLADIVAGCRETGEDLSAAQIQELEKKLGRTTKISLAKFKEIFASPASAPPTPAK